MFPETNPAPGFIRFPDHKITISTVPGEVVVEFEGVELVRSSDALLLEETNHAPVHYIPIDHIHPEFLRDSSHVTRCPFKGKARYWNIRVGNHEIDNALWAYEMPYDEVLELAGLAAFHPGKVKVTID
jgi:uncharacterized protein (DUF427 family)